MSLKKRIVKIEKHQGTREDDRPWLGPYSQLKIDSIHDWLVMKEIVDDFYQKIKSGELENDEHTDKAMCLKILSAIRQSKQIPVPGERLATA